MRFITLLLAFFGLPSSATLIDRLYPVLLLPLKKSRPDTAFSTQKDAIVSYHV
jgi:hypothetical protein